MNGDSGLAGPPPAWSGYAAIDVELLGDAESRPPDTSLLATLLKEDPTRCRAVTYPGRRSFDAILLDRDGTIIHDVHYLADPAGVRLLPGAIDGLQRLQRLGLRLVIVTNQSGVGVGSISSEALAAVNHRLVQLLADAGVSVAGIYICPHRRDAGCSCRKPGTALALQASAELGIDLSRVLVVGDKALDLGLARALGAPAYLVTTGHGEATLAAGEIIPDFLVDGLDALAATCEAAAGLPVPVALPITLDPRA